MRDRPGQRWILRSGIARVLITLILMIVASPALANEARGVVRADSRAILSSEIAARVLSVPFRTGERFDEGDVLVRFDCRLYERQQDKVEAQHDAARARLASAERLAELQSGSLLDLALAQAEARQAEADSALLRLNLERCLLRAPYAGRVVQRVVNAHEFVQAHTELMEVVSTVSLSAEVVVPGRWLRSLAPGDTVSMMVEETGDPVEGVLTRLAASVDPASQTATVHVELGPHPERVLPGMTVVARFEQAL